MEIDKYQALSTRFMNPDLTHDEKIYNMCLGLSGEVGEVNDAIKKAKFQGHDLDYKNLHEELGDVMWYLSNLASILGFKMDDILEANYRKLSKRYPFGFTVNDSKLRRDKM